MTFAEVIECTIDFEGQRLADQLTYYLLFASGVISFITGYALQSLPILLAVFTSGFILTLLVVVPPWPMYNKHPQPWIKGDAIIEKKE